MNIWSLDVFSNLFDLCITRAPQATPWWANWSLAPEILAPIVAAAFFHTRRLNGLSTRMLAAAGWTIMGLALFSPLCRLAAALVSAHMLQLSLIAIIAPAVIAASARLPTTDGRWSDHKASKTVIHSSRLPLSVPAIVYGAVIWAWHAPRIYDEALVQPAVHVGVILAVVGSALWFFHRIFYAHAAQTGAAILVLLVTMAHTGLLGAVLTFAPDPLYLSNAHALATWGLDAKADQQLAGLIMWAPSGFLYLCVALMLVVRLMAEPVRRGVTS